MAKAPTPSGMKFRMTLFCSNAEWVAKKISGIGSWIWKSNSRDRRS